MGFFARFRNVLVVLDLAAEAEQTLRVTERLTPAVERVHCMCLPNAGAELEGLEPERNDGPLELDSLLAAWRTRNPDVQLSRAFEGRLDAAHIARVVEEQDIDLVVLGPLAAHAAQDRANLLLRLSARQLRHVLSVGASVQVPPESGQPWKGVALALDPDAAALPALARLVAQLPSDARVTALVPKVSELRAQELRSMFVAFAPHQRVVVQMLEASATTLPDALEQAARELAVDLVVCGVDAVSDLEVLTLGFLAGSTLQKAGCPVLVLPRTQDAPIYMRERLLASDALLTPASDPRLFVERVSALGRLPLAENEALMVVQGGLEQGPFAHQDGALSLPRSLFAAELPEHALVIETRAAAPETATARVLNPQKPLILLEASLHELPLPSIREAAAEHELVFVRMRRDHGLDHIRERLDAYNAVLGVPYLIDASTWLDDAEAEDVPSLVDGQRLLRVGLRLMAAGLAVKVVVTREQHLHTRAFHTITAKEWAGFDFERAPLARPSAQLGGSEAESSALERELDLYTESTRTRGHSVHLEFDNRSARHALLSLIAAAKQRIHWQCYIVEDDATTAEFAHALSAAARRGVEVRFLADAVYSLHDAFGQTNAFLKQLAGTPGVSVRAFRPVTGLPNLSALKRRNHRKCIVIDGLTAVVTGRNLAAPYYRSFEEVTLQPESPYREVPWLDCGATFRGPLVKELERSFAREWRHAGGEDYELMECPAVGSLAARLILHDGLRDTHTFDAQLSMIRHARRELIIVNNFPLVIELQRALMAAIRRGVRVRVLFGSVRPRFGADEPFPGGTIRSLADQLVRARLDPVILAGGEAYEYALPAFPHWDSRLGQIFPHVHAKLLLRDGEDVATGSANLDVTAAYWESEVMLVVHDAAYAADVQRQLEPLFASARPVLRGSDSFRAEAAQRAWLSRYWPSLIG